MDDPGEPATIETGLVYSCPIGPGTCEGVRGDTNDYIGGNINNTNGIQISLTTLGDSLFTDQISEGRLFDQARKWNALCHDNNLMHIGMGGGGL